MSQILAVVKILLILSARLKATEFLLCSHHSSQLFLSIRKTLLESSPKTLFLLTSLATIRSISLEINFDFAFLITLLVSAENPMTRLGLNLLLAIVARISGFFIVLNNNLHIRKINYLFLAHYFDITHSF